MTKCEICGSDDCAGLFRKGSFTIARCSNCSVVFLLPRPTFAQMKRFYESVDYYRFWGDINAEGLRNVERIRRLTYDKLLLSLSKFRQPGELLDIGSAAGYFLDAAQEDGWSVYGIEPCSRLADMARQKFGDHVFAGMFEEFDGEDDSFDALILYDTLEHMLNPLSVLRRCWRLLRSRGIICIVTPNVASLSARMMKRHWTHFKQEHLYYFCPKTIALVLSKAGFEVCEIGRSVKALNVEYMSNQFNIFPTPLLTPLFRFLSAALPGFAASAPFYVLTGNMTVIARKKSHPQQGESRFK